MARYFFHFRDDVESIDELGTELAGPEEARRMAVVASGEALRDLGARFWNSPEWRVWVTDESGRTVCTLRLSAEAGDIGET